MSSLLTNNSAMVALQTMRAIGRDLGDVQNQISTGKRIATARDNAALWSIASVMKSDVTGFKAISESLSLGVATLNVARDGAETVARVLDTLKGRVVAAQEENVDRNKVQADVDQLIDQVRVVVAGTQFNGLNALNDFRDVDVLASLNRTAVPDGADTLSPDWVRFQTHDLSTKDGTAGTDPVTTTIAYVPTTAETGSVDEAAATAIEFEFAAREVATGDSYALTLTPDAGDPKTYIYVAAPGDTLNTVVRGLALQMSLDAPDDTGGTVTVATPGDPTTTAPKLSFAGGVAYTALVEVNSGGTPTGRLRGLDKFDVTSAVGAAAALGAMESYIEAAISAAAEFGSAQGAMDTADRFVGRMIDSLTEGVGALVDADMESASARLQALQVQQQLGVQALNIANQTPQNILALFQQ
ncbi:flagellin N-terminal helical domain-containing protein [Rubrimonas sp.]|uniref:flagellin N-terminal helical domain-containing protein n=1 Tax=Rubrimonas sp. TaxID=2036015 RepID=UPI002FDF07F1